MSGPKHLWAGDWESDSDRAHEQRAAQSPPSSERETPEEPTAPGGRRRRLSRRTLATLVVSALVLAGIGVALGETLGGSGNPKHKAPTAQTRTSPWTVTSAPPGAGPSGGAPVMTPTKTGPSAQWLGMEIVTSPSGTVISTVSIGSIGDQAGFDPGDVITAIDGHMIAAATDIKSVTAKLALGASLQIRIARGSTVMSLPVSLKDRPTIQP